MIALIQGAITVEIALRPPRVTVWRDRTQLLSGATVHLLDGFIHDHFIRWTEGVIDREEIVDRLDARAAEVVAHARDSVSLSVSFAGGRTGTLQISFGSDERVRFACDAPDDVLRCALTWRARPDERFTGLGARHCTRVDQTGREIQLGADRRYTGPDCPPEMLASGGIPQGDYAPVPFVSSSHGWAAWIETYGNGTRVHLDDEVALSIRTAAGLLIVHLYTQPTPVGRLRAHLRGTGLPALLPEWGYGHWKSRDVYEHQRDVESDFDCYANHRLPLDAIVLDSPWETTYNTWKPNPHQFPDFGGMINRFRAAGVRSVAWTTPWTNLESVDGQRPPDAASERLSRQPAANYAEGKLAGHYVRNPDGSPFVTRWWMGTGSPVDFTSAAAEAWWRAQAEELLALGVQGIKADDGEGYYLPDDVRFADGRTGAVAAWAHGLLYRRCMQRALDAVHPGDGVLFGRSGWSGHQSVGMTWAGDQASDFWSLRTLVVATLTAAASGFSNWSHDVGGYLGERLVARCPKELLIRWAQFGCFTPLMHAHGRFEQEPWTYDAETLSIYRSYLVLHEQLVPYVRAAAATAARSGLPIIRPLSLLEPDSRGWLVSDAYGYGPSMWVAPVLDAGAVSREVPLPHGRWIDFWTGEAIDGGDTIVCETPLHRLPVFVRDGALIPTYAREDVARGLGNVPDRDRRVELTLWGVPRGHRAVVKLADGTRLTWTLDGTTTSPAREVTVRSMDRGW
jgi:alpha-glucosidase (family GH31 glycosyl hydrolase)